MALMTRPDVSHRNEVTESALLPNVSFRPSEYPLGQVTCSTKPLVKLMNGHHLAERYKNMLNHETINLVWDAAERAHGNCESFEDEAIRRDRQVNSECVATVAMVLTTTWVQLRHCSNSSARKS